MLDDGARYVYGNGLVAQVAGANTYYYLSDGLGSTVKTTDASGNVVNGYTYDVYGKTTSSSGSQANDVQFAGQQTDPTGLQYLRARYYDPETGAFLSRDALSAMPGWSGSPFGYAGGNPAALSDPSGLRAGPPWPANPHQCMLCWRPVSPEQFGFTIGDSAVWLEGLSFRGGSPFLFRFCKIIGEYTQCGIDSSADFSDGGAYTRSQLDDIAVAVAGAITPTASNLFWKGLNSYGRKGIRTNGLGGSKRRYYQWDYTHGDVEVYDSAGYHLGSADPKTGEIIKDPVRGRDIKNELK